LRNHEEIEIVKQYMKKSTVLFFLILTSFVFSQQNICVEYKLDLTIDEDLQSKIDNGALGNFLLNSLEREIEISDDLTFSLVIQDTISRFYLSDMKNSVEDKMENEFLFYSSYSGEMFYFGNKVYNYNKYSQIYVYTDYDSNWNISSETKTINDLVCYKATSTRTVINPKGVFNLPVVAWFCPEIPHSVGPIGFCGLPGLIVQLKYKTATYSLSRILFNNDIKFDFSNLKSKPFVSFEENEKKILDSFQNLKE
jgi:GLPGLI family protein